MDIKKAMEKTGKATTNTLGKGQYAHRVGSYLKWGHLKNTFVGIDGITDNDWQPYHEVKEIRPEKAGELWKGEMGGLYFTVSQLNGSINLRYINGATYDVDNAMIHGENGWERVHPPVKDDSVEIKEGKSK